MSDHKKIAKNTLVLYVRMALQMVIGLFTSRLVLQALGVDDFGVYNVVGGIVGLLGFLNSAMVASTQRFLNVGMSKNDSANQRLIFSTAINVHVLIGIFTVILLETFGLWFLNTQVVVPPGQLYAAQWVFQCSVATFFLTIIYAPYNAALIANEKMTAFAVMSIVGVVLHLGFVIYLYFSSGNRLITYGFLQLGEAVIMRLLYGWYCRRKLPECRYKYAWDKPLVKKMMGFSGWMLFGCISDLLSGQGVNMLINVFFGPAYNAARGIAMTVYNTIAQFSNNFIISANPQIVQGYASQDYDNTYKLVFLSSRLAFYLMLIMGLPIILNAPLLLHYWLGVVPPLAPLFVQLIVLEYTVRSSYSPLAVINQAHGKIRTYQLSISCLFLATFVLTYIFFKVGFPVYTTFILSVGIAIIGLFTRLLVLHKEQHFPVKSYLRRVSLKILWVIIVAAVPAYAVTSLCDATFFGMLLSCIADLLITVAAIWIVGLEKNERTMVMTLIRKKLHLQPKVVPTK